MFRGLLDSGMTKEQFKELTGVEMPEDRAMKLKDFDEATNATLVEDASTYKACAKGEKSIDKKRFYNNV